MLIGRLRGGDRFQTGSVLPAPSDVGRWPAIKSRSPSNSRVTGRSPDWTSTIRGYLDEIGVPGAKPHTPIAQHTERLSAPTLLPSPRAGRSSVVRSASPAPWPYGLTPPDVETPVNLACSLPAPPARPPWTRNLSGFPSSARSGTGACHITASEGSGVARAPEKRATPATPLCYWISW